MKQKVCAQGSAVSRALVRASRERGSAVSRARSFALGPPPAPPPRVSPRYFPAASRHGAALGRPWPAQCGGSSMSLEGEVRGVISTASWNPYKLICGAVRSVVRAGPDQASEGWVRTPLFKVNHRQSAPVTSHPLGRWSRPSGYGHVPQGDGHVPQGDALRMTTKFGLNGGGGKRMAVVANEWRWWQTIVTRFEFKLSREFEYDSHSLPSFPPRRYLIHTGTRLIRNTRGRVHRAATSSLPVSRGHLGPRETARCPLGPHETGGEESRPLAHLGPRRRRVRAEARRCVLAPLPLQLVPRALRRRPPVPLRLGLRGGAALTGAAGTERDCAFLGQVGARLASACTLRYPVFVTLPSACTLPCHAALTPRNAGHAGWARCPPRPLRRSAAA